MAEIIKEAISPHSPSAMFDLVADIHSYPKFLPWCPKTEIHNPGNPLLTDATIYVQKGFIKFSFRTLNTNKKPDSIEMNLIEGPFRELKGLWEFLPLGALGDLSGLDNLDKDKNSAPKACKIRFSLSYIFSNRALDMTLNPLMQNLADSFLDAFCREAMKPKAINP
jgi:ribosome-associated toxin RatA of RatAB toxin-antitoxin module